MAEIVSGASRLGLIPTRYLEVEASKNNRAIESSWRGHIAQREIITPESIGVTLRFVNPFPLKCLPIDIP